MRINKLTYAEAKGKKFRLPTWGNSECYIEIRSDNRWWFYTNKYYDGLTISENFYECDEKGKRIEVQKKDIYPIYAVHTSQKVVKFTGLKEGKLLKFADKGDEGQLIGEPYSNWISHNNSMEWTSISLGATLAHEPPLGSEDYFKFWDVINEDVEVFTHVLITDKTFSKGYYIKTYSNDKSSGDMVQNWESGYSSVTDKVCSIHKALSSKLEEFLQSNFHPKPEIKLNKAAINDAVEWKIPKRTLSPYQQDSIDRAVNHLEKTKQPVPSELKQYIKKGNNMSNIDKAMKAFCKELQDHQAPKKPKTDFEIRPTILGVVYDEDKCEEAIIPFSSQKAVKKYLQKPENFGKTVATYTIGKSLTTNMPIMEVK